MADARGTQLPSCYTAAQAVHRSGITPVVFNWLVHTEHIELPRIGNRAVYTDAVIRAVQKVFREKDPTGRFLTYIGRKNGPQRRKAAKPTVASEN
jgi:hypothetical protein